MRKLELAPLHRAALFDPTISIDDTKNPNNTSCVICKMKYSSIKSFQSHMRNYHSDGRNTPVDRSKHVGCKRRKSVNPNIQSDPTDPSFFCRSCRR